MDLEFLNDIKPYRKKKKKKRGVGEGMTLKSKCLQAKPAELLGTLRILGGLSSPAAFTTLR